MAAQGQNGFRNKGSNMSKQTLRAQLDALAARPDSGKGVEFEKWLVEHLPKLAEMEIARAWRWSDSPQNIRSRCFGRKVAASKSDPGIDILAERTDGGIIAIQAKCQAPDKQLSIDAHKLSNFWVPAGKGAKLAGSMIITTGLISGTNVQKQAEQQGCALISAQTNWGDLTESDLRSRKPHQLDEQQQAAFKDCVKGFRPTNKGGWGADRGRLIMACGTGKTLVSQRVAERVAPNKGIVLYATPSIALTAQSRRAWLTNAKRPLRTIVVCSDDDAGKGGGDISSTEIEAPVTTDPKEIAGRIKGALKGLPPNGLVAIFSTYQSLQRVCVAQKMHGAPVVDFAIADEAHQTATGKYDRSKPSQRQFIHHELNANRRLYQTATPRIYSKRRKVKIRKHDVETHDTQTITDISNAAVYGPELHRLTFMQALKAKSPRLCDYRIVVLFVPQEDMDCDAAQGKEAPSGKSAANMFTTALAQRICALALAMQNKRAVEGVNGNGGLGEIHGCIAFLNRVEKAREAAKLLANDRLATWARSRTVSLNWVREGLPVDNIRSGSLSGGDDAVARNRELRSLRTARGAGKHVTTNVHVLSEGVDVPALDAICFLDPRKSEVDIVQAVGRVMRKPAEGDKKHGFIIVPVVMPRQTAMDIATEPLLDEYGEEWRVLGQVLRALRSHDERIETDLSRLIIAPSGGGSGGGGGGKGGAPLDFWERLARGDYDFLIPKMVGMAKHPDRAAEVQNLIRAAVNNAASALGQETGLAKTLRPLVGLADAKKGSLDRRTCVMVALTWMNACLVHQRITEQKYIADAPPLSKCRNGPKIAAELLQAWRTVREHDYKPIFEPAIKLIETAMPGKAAPEGVKAALQTLSAHAEECAAEYAEMGMDHAGSLFNAAMDQAQSDGAYYTMPPGAQLLAELACDLYADEKCPMWRKPDTWRKLAVMDPACGSGTLLAAFAQAVRRRAKKGGAADDQLAKCHKALVEQGMIGLDINPQAVQIAAAQLVMGGLSASFKDMGLWVRERGRAKNVHPKKPPSAGEVRIGSLELLQGDGEAGDSFAHMLKDADGANAELSGAQVKGGDDDDDASLTERRKRVGLVLTNPPFSTMANAASDLDQPVRSAMQMRLKQIKEQVAARHPDFDKVLQADSMRPPFTFIAAEHINKKHGVLGKVVPTTACNSSAAASVQERRFLAAEFEIDKIITLHDPKRMKWSLEGHQESLLLMRRKPKAQRAKHVQFISVRQFPNDAEAAAKLYEGIKSGKMDDMGRICEWPRERVDDGEWWPALFFEPGLARATGWVIEQCAASSGFAVLGDFCEVRTTRQIVGQSKWDWCENKTAPGCVPVLKGAGKDAQEHIAGRVDAYAVPAKGQAPQRTYDNLWEKRGRLLASNSQDSASGRLHAVALRNEAVGYGWTPVQGLGFNAAKSLAVWLNSTPMRLIWRTLGSSKG